MGYFAGKPNLARKAEGQDHGIIEVVAHPGSDVQTGVAVLYAATDKSVRSYYVITPTGEFPLKSKFSLEHDEFKPIPE
jgi:hypothetical protein